MKTWFAAILITIGFTLWGTGDESLTMTVLICIAKLALIIGGGVLLTDGLEEGEA